MRSATSIVSYEVSHALNLRARRLGHSPQSHEFWPANEGPRRTDGTWVGVPHPTVVDEGAEQGRRFIICTSAREALEEHAASEAIRRAAATLSRPIRNIRAPVPSVSFTDTNLANEWKRYLGLAALVGPHGRSSMWARFGGRACLCATEHLRGVTRIAWASMRGHTCTSCAGQPKRYRKTTRT